MDRKPKTVFQLDIPFTTAAWPQISPQDQETILELLCRLLTPIGRHRASRTTKSQGKRSKKRKRQEAKQQHAGETQETSPPIPPAPEISSFVVAGLNSITRTLQTTSKKPDPSPSPAGDSQPDPDPGEEPTTHPISQTNPSDPSTPIPLFSAIFVLRSSQPAILHAHFPQLIATASLAHPESPAPRLVQLPRSSDERICRALGLPRVSFIGLVEGAPHCKPLVDLIRDKVPEIEVPWLEEVKRSLYLPVKINAIETFASMPKKKPA